MRRARLHEAAGPPTPELLAEWARLHRRSLAPLPQGYTSEICLRAGPWIASLADAWVPARCCCSTTGCRGGTTTTRSARRARCAATSATACTMTLTSTSACRTSPPGCDFTRLALAADAAGLTVAGFATQAAFLLASGLETLRGEASGDRERVRLAGEARRLVMPEEMGEAFKVMALTRALPVPLAGSRCRTCGTSCERKAGAAAVRCRAGTYS